MQGIVTYSASTNVDISSALDYSDDFPVDIQDLPTETQAYIISTASCQSSNTSISSKATDITQDCSSIQEAVEELAKWIRLNVSYSSSGDQDAVSVYNRNPKTGNCTGQTCLMIAFLRSLNIPARFVSGILINKQYSIPGPYGQTITLGNSGPGRHALYEVYYPSQGWVFGDPQKFLHYRDANFIKRAYAKDPTEIRISFGYAYQGSQPVFDGSFPIDDISSSIGSINPNLIYQGFSLFGSGSQKNLYAVEELIIPVGIYDEIEIVEPPTGTANCKSQQLPDNTLMFYLGDNINFSAEFTSYYCNTSVTTIYWKIILHHAGGEYTFISDQYSGAGTCYNPGSCKDGYYWEYTAPSSLPDYDWQFDIYGNILGEAIVEADLSDEDFISDTEWISIICKETVSNTEITSNTTISACNIDLIGVVIKNGCTVTCSTDGTIYIQDVTIQDNSTLIIEADSYDVLIEDNFEVETGSIIDFRK